MISTQNNLITAVVKSKVSSSLILAFVANSAAAAGPNAGSIANQQQISNKGIVEELEKSDGANHIKVLVKDITISMKEPIGSADELKAVIADAKGKALDFNQLDQMANRVTHYLRNQGYPLAIAYLPKQDITEGVVEIVVTNGKLQDGEAGEMIRKERDSVRVDSGVKDSELAGKTRDKIEGNFSVDNFGKSSVGDWRGNLGLTVNNPFGWNDQLAIGGTGSENMAMANAKYSLPIGTVVGNVHYNHMEYSISGLSGSQNDQGTTNYTGAGFTYTFLKTSEYKISGIVDFTHKEIQDYALNKPTTHKFVDLGGVGISGKMKSFGGVTRGSILVNIGNVDLMDVKSDYAKDLATAKTNGSFGRFNFNVSRLQKLTDRFSVYANANGQLASTNLASSEKFVIGGPFGVRGYAPNACSGDSGWLVNFELRYDVPMNFGNLQLIGFADTGHVTLHKKRWMNDVESSNGRNEYSLSAAGVGANFVVNNRFSVKGTWAHTINGNPGSAANSDDNRFWLQTNINF